MKKNYSRLRNEDSSSSVPERAFEKFKQRIYLTIFEILETNTMSENKGIFLIAILNLQLILMTCNDKNIDLQNSAIETLLPLTNYVLLFPQLLAADTMLFNILFLVIVFILLTFLFVTLFYLSMQTSFDSPLIKQLKGIWGFLCELADKILLIPVFGLTAGNVSCNFNTSQTDCNSGPHIVLIILSIICSIMLFALELVYSYLFFNFTFKIKDALSRNPSGMPVFFFFCRLAITIFQSLLDLNVQSNYTILVLLHLLLGLILMYDSLNTFPYHNKNVSKSQGIFISVYLWINATFMLLQLTNIDMLHENVLVIVGLGTAFFLKLFLNIRNYFVKVLMNSELDEIEGAVLLDLKIRYYNTLSKTLDIKKSELLLASLLKIHYDKCKNQTTCPCRKRNSLIDPKKKLTSGDSKLQLHKDDVFVKHFIARMAKDGLNKFKDSKLLYLDYMFYRFEALRLYSSIYFEITRFENKYHNDSSLSIEFCLHRLRAKLCKYLTNRNQKGDISRRLKVENVKFFDEGMMRQKENTMNVNKNLNELWESLCEEKPDLSKILEVGNVAIKNIKKTTDQYEVLLALNNQSQDLLNLMTIFATYLTYDDLLQAKIEKDIDQAKDMENDNSMQQDVKQLIKKYQIFDKQSCVISISPVQESIGQIVWCSRNVRNVFDYDDVDLLNMNVNQLMPEPIALCHNRILKYYYDNGRELLTTKLTHLWAIDSQKVCFSCNIYIKILPTLSGYDIVGFVHKLNQDDYIIADVDGMMYSVGRKVSDHLKLSPEFISETRVNMQLIAPTLQKVFKNYFINFDIMPQEQRISTVYEEDEIQELKFFFLISKENKLKIQSFIETRANVFKKYNIDLVTKESLAAETGSQNQMHHIKNMIKQALDFRKDYAGLFYKVNKQIMVSKLESIVKVKAQCKTFSFWSGTKVVQLKVIKINSYEPKSRDYIKVNQNKVREQEKVVKIMFKELQKDHNDFRTKKMKLKEEEEQDNYDELEAINQKGESDDPNQANQSGKSGFMFMFKKGGKQGPTTKAGSLFSKFNKFSGGGGKNQEQTEDQLKKGILETLFKKQSNPKAKVKRPSKQVQQGSQIQSQERVESKNLNMEESDEEVAVKKKIELPPEQLEQIRACAAIPKVLGALYKANLVGQMEWSVFSDPVFQKKYIVLEGLELKFAKIRALFKSEKFQKLVTLQRNKKKANSQSSDTDEDREDESQIFEEEKTQQRSLLQNLINNQGNGEEEKAAMQSVSSSTQSLQAHNAQRMLREQLKNMKAPTVLIIAHYTMISLSMVFFAFMISQYVYMTKDFEGIKEELLMFRRVSNYSDSLIQLLDGYYTLQMIAEGPLKGEIYGDQWITQYKQQLTQTQSDIVNFFLDDFSQAGTQSNVGNDLRSYLFIEMNAEMLINKQSTKFVFNFENYVRLLVNAINATISLDISQYSMDSESDYMYFIYHNMDSFIEATDTNYVEVLSTMQSTRDSLLSRFYTFWILSFAILFILYLFTYPIILRTKQKIQETLKLFTMISLANVEYYSNHYKMIFYMFKTQSDTSTLLKKVEDDVAEAYAEKKRKDQQNNQKTLARARAFKGIQINKILFFTAMSLWLLTFSGFLFIKDYFIVQFVDHLDLLNQLQGNQHQLKFKFQKNFVQFKNLYYLYYINQTSVDDLNTLIEELQTYEINVLLRDNYQNFATYSSSYSDFADELSSGNICQAIDIYINNYPNSSRIICEGLFDGILMNSGLNFYQNFQNDMLNGLNQLGSGLNQSSLIQFIQEPRFQEYTQGLFYMKLTNELWSALGREAYSNGIENEISYNKIFVIVMSIILFLFLIFVWGREFSTLQQNSRWVNGFILLIPTELRQENKKINSFLKNQLKIQGLMYV